ncbi:hypothetical protein BJ165DRAFT_1520102 [Panaeolus papilionaceus]|nr:hypothetical protein BJ165DRAFT_1520102 [Panaeolus papilionaceus]
MMRLRTLHPLVRLPAVASELELLACVGIPTGITELYINLAHSALVPFRLRGNTPHHLKFTEAPEVHASTFFLEEIAFHGLLSFWSPELLEQYLSVISDSLVSAASTDSLSFSQMRTNGRAVADHLESLTPFGHVITASRFEAFYALAARYDNDTNEPTVVPTPISGSSWRVRSTVDLGAVATNVASRIANGVIAPAPLIPRRPWFAVGRNNGQGPRLVRDSTNARGQGRSRGGA